MRKVDCRYGFGVRTRPPGPSHCAFSSCRSVDAYVRERSRQTGDDSPIRIKGRNRKNVRVPDALIFGQRCTAGRERRTLAGRPLTLALLRLNSHRRPLFDEALLEHQPGSLAKRRSRRGFDEQACRSGAGLLLRRPKPRPKKKIMLGVSNSKAYSALKTMRNRAYAITVVIADEALLSLSERLVTPRKAGINARPWSMGAKRST